MVLHGEDHAFPLQLKENLETVQEHKESRKKEAQEEREHYHYLECFQELLGLNGRRPGRELARIGNQRSSFYFEIDEEAFASPPLKSGPLETSFC